MMHQISTAALLRSLRGFRDARPDERPKNAIPRGLIIRMREIAARTARYGELQELAETHGRSADSLSVQICRLRRGGYVPKSWGAVG